MSNTLYQCNFPPPVAPISLLPSPLPVLFSFEATPLMLKGYSWQCSGDCRGDRIWIGSCKAETPYPMSYHSVTRNRYPPLFYFPFRYCPHRFSRYYTALQGL